MENIQAHMRTTEFGKTAGESNRTITRDELEEIDLKIGYITKKRLLYWWVYRPIKIKYINVCRLWRKNAIYFRKYRYNE